MCLLCFCELLQPLTATALNPERLPSQYLYERFGRDRGLPSDTVWVTREGPQGYLWIGTRAGLVRFDGQRFTVFNQQTNSAFQANDIRDLEWTPSGELWIATYGGGAVRMRNGEFERFAGPAGLQADIVYDIHRAANGAMWFATDNGVSRLQNSGIDSWTRDDGLAGNRVIKIAESDNGDLWFADIIDGLSHFNGREFRAVGVDEGLDSLKIHLLANDPELGVVAGTSTGTVYQVGTTDPLMPLPWSSDVGIEDILLDKDGSRWLGTYGNGLWRLQADGQKEQFDFAEDSGSSHVFSMLEDRYGSLWIATSRGLFRIRDSSFLAIGRYEGLADSTFVVTGASDGTLWAGAEARGLFRVDTDGTISQPYSELIDKDVSALLLRRNGELWVGTFGDGIYCLKGTEIRRVGGAQGLASEHVFALKETADGNVWIGTSGGVNRWSENASPEFMRVEELGAARVRHITEGRDGRLWLSSGDGLYEFSPSNTRRWGRAEGLPNDIVIATHEDDRGVLWVVMRDGSIARLEDNQLFHFGEVEQLQRLSAFSIVEDERRQLWIAGATGLMRVSRDDLDAIAQGNEVLLRQRLYSEADGLRSSQFIGGFQPSAWVQPDGRFWLATAQGLTGFHPTELDYEHPVPRTFIEAIRVNGEAVPLTEPVQLPAAIRSLEVDYSAPELNNARAVSFRYSLADNNTWEEVGGRRTAYFTSFPAGERVLRVQAQMGEGAFTTTAIDATEITFFREPRWSETTWPVLVGSLLLFTGLTLLQQVLSRRARERERELRALVSIRTEELSEALQQVEANARIDALTGVANRRHMEERLAAAWNLARRTGAKLSVIMVDIDRFNHYNETLGTDAGDICLRRLATAINANLLREHDMVARYSGEQFLLMLYDTNKDGARAAAKRLLECIRRLELPHPASEISAHVTVSMGYSAGGRSDCDSSETLIKEAMDALQKAKSAGGNQIAAS